MSCVVGIVSEYNPFHNGHKYQVEQIRKELPEATIIAIMSGNIVQRGEFAMLDKYFRARIAMENGINAVFELPYPYSGSTAEIFASAGVEIAHKLGCDYLYFGTEDEGLDRIEKLSEIIDSEEFEDELKKQVSDNGKGFLQAKSDALKKFGYELPKSSNDILALEYIRAIKKRKIGLKWRTVKRIGAKYNDDSVCDIMSASAIRKHFLQCGRFVSVPSIDCYELESENGHTLNYEYMNRYLHQHVLCNSEKISSAFDSNKEIAGIVSTLSLNCDSIEFFEKLSSKIYTTSRLRRVILYSLFDEKNVDTKPSFTFLLGVDDKGRSLLNCVKKQSDFLIITKHSDLNKLNESDRCEAEKRYRIDALYNTMLRVGKTPSCAYKTKPFIK